MTHPGEEQLSVVLDEHRPTGQNGVHPVGGVIVERQHVCSGWPLSATAAAARAASQAILWRILWPGSSRRWCYTPPCPRTPASTERQRLQLTSRARPVDAPASGELPPTLASTADIQ